MHRGPGTGSQEKYSAWLWPQGCVTPKVLILDEPTANVDESSALLVKNAAVSAWKEWGTTVIVATMTSRLTEVSTDIISLYRGRIVGHGTENLVHGPWIRRTEALSGNFRTDRRSMLFHRAEMTTAPVINPSDISVHRIPSGPVTEMNILKGTVTSMTLERATGCALISVQVGDIVLKSRMTVDKMKEDMISRLRSHTHIFAGKRTLDIGTSAYQSVSSLSENNVEWYDATADKNFPLLPRISVRG